MKDKTKKWLAVAGLLAVCAVLVFGISRVLYHEPVSYTHLDVYKRQGRGTGGGRGAGTGRRRHEHGNVT